MDQPFLARLRTSPRLAAATVGAIGVLLAAGIWIGWAEQANASAERSDRLQSRLDDANDLLERYRVSERASSDAQDEADAEKQEYEDKQAALDEKLAAADTLQKQLDEQQKKVAASQMTDGMHVVGTDLEPGVYSISESTNCYYVWKSGTGADASIVDNNIVNGPATVTLKAGEVFETNRCGTWTKVG